MAVSHLRDLYLEELQEMRSAEDLMTNAMPKLARQATHTGLSKMLEDDVADTRAHRERLEAILTRHGANPREHRDQSMAALVAEAEKWAGQIDDPECRDTALIASAQRLQHYEIAAYGSLATWAKQLGFQEDLDQLLAILDEEKRADETLTDLAKSVVNPSAA
ncbi:DUF892 family protein [Salinarimonas sp.]|uniref:YciE/YciF ferroxidase family protein n=1 Tax=Salinarimonas sp. TaxID=2766526 RepID=UPI0032D8B4B4